MRDKKKERDKRKEAADMKANLLNSQTNRAQAMKKLIELKKREEDMKDNKRVFVREDSIITVFGKGIEPSLAELPLEIERMKAELIGWYGGTLIKTEG